MAENPNVVFSTVMFAPSGADTTVAAAMIANGGKMTPTQGNANLDEVFADLVGSFISVKNFTI